MRLAWLLPAPLIAACGFASVATGDGSIGADGDAAATEAAAADPTRTQDGSTTAPVGGDGGVCEPSACPGLRCENGVCSAFTDCRDLRDNGPANTKSGTYTFVRSAAPPFTAYCEMALAGGGWTLVGQSGAGTTTSFGWHQTTGSVAAETAPYSLDAIGHGLTMTEVLLATGARSSIRAAYLAVLPAGFPAGFENKAASDRVTRVQNPDCSTGSTPSMMSNIGFTALPAQFFFRDNTGSFGTGLLPNGWDLYYSNDCDKEGKIKGSSGMLFTR